MQIDLEQTPPDTLADLGLVHEYPLHIDVLNNETGFGLYLVTPPAIYEDEGWAPLAAFERDAWVEAVHVDDYTPGMAPEYYVEDSYVSLHLHIREVDDVTGPGDWHTLELDENDFVMNTNPPAALGMDEFDSVTWLEGLEPGKEYEVQLWFDLEEGGNGQLNSQGRWERGTKEVYNREEGTYSVVPGDYYYWQEADVYSGIHTINTDPDAFNVDIDADGTMDFFVEGYIDPAQDMTSIPDFTFAA